MDVERVTRPLEDVCQVTARKKLGLLSQRMTEYCSFSVEERFSGPYLPLMPSVMLRPGSRRNPLFDSLIRFDMSKNASAGENCCNQYYEETNRSERKKALSGCNRKEYPI